MESMKAYRMQRSSGGGHAVNIQEDLYIPELGASFYAITEDLMSPPIIGRASHEEMSREMFEDLTQVSQGKIPKRTYSISSRGEGNLTLQEVEALEEKLRNYQELRTKLESPDLGASRGDAERELGLITDELFATIVGQEVQYS